uniref:2Fe-2S ferredoxin-type domain-containing protein n=1 Tax=Strix occidentalis caurina TaxID=311401 RepID=A0A8D0KUW5_STROC
TARGTGQNPHCSASAQRLGPLGHWYLLAHPKDLSSGRAGGVGSSDFCNLFYSSADQVTVHFVNRDGERFTAIAKEGESLLEVVVNQNLAIDGFGACEGTLACSTCHLIFEKDTFQKLDAISDEELDMLDLAYGLTETSRLGCQVCIKKSMDGLTVRVPVDVSDIRRQMEVGKQSKQ